jgi:phospholipase/lecithinase/hemolysin
MRSLLTATLGLLCLTQPSHGHATSPYSEIVAFCDSLSDVGNVAGITEEGTSPLIDGYYEETHFSDNIIWVEYLADYWGLPAPTPGRGDTTSLEPQPDGTDWSWGGAEAGTGTVQPDGTTEPLPNLVTQVEQYLLHNTPKRDALYVMWCGANNLLVGEKFGPAAARAAVESVIASLQALEAAGARHFLVVNMPRLGDTPDAQDGGVITEAIANLYSLLYNGFLDFELARLRFDPRFRANIYFANAYTMLALIVDTVDSGETYVPDSFVPGPPVAIDNVADQALAVSRATTPFPPTTCSGMTCIRPPRAIRSSPA